MQKRNSTVNATGAKVEVVDDTNKEIRRKTDFKKKLEERME
jgi:hypothetical protein